jgi:imidazolonepropionase-like amidohydrolase
MPRMQRILILFLLSLMHGSVARTQWVQTEGPRGGMITSWAVSGTKIFAGTDGGVFLSTNNGASWTAASLTNTNVSALAVSDTNLFAGIWGGGVFRSTNTDTNWIAVNTGLTNKNINSFAVSGTNFFSGTDGDGVFLSTNNGANWTRTSLTKAWVNALAVSPNAAGDTNLFTGVHAFAEAPVLVFEHANLIDGICDSPQRDVTVIVAEGKIKVVSAATISPPANAKRFDLSGRWLLPGFIDAHIHPVNTEWAKSLLAIGGMTTGRSMLTVRYVDVELRERHRRGEYDIPDILAAGYPVVPRIGTFPIPGNMATVFEDNPQLKDLRGDTSIGVAGAQRLVRANLDRHVDVIKVFATNRAGDLSIDPRGRALSNEQLVAAVAEAHNAGIPVAAHAYGDDGVAAAVRAGVSSIEHGVYLTDATLELMKEKNVFFVPTISAFPLHGQTESNASRTDASAARGQDMAISVRDAARRAHKMGLRVIAGTDGARIGDEIIELAGIGMTPMEAIRAATSRCAEALGISKRTGSIRPGLEADLVVLDGNPLEDIKAVKKVVLVVNDGRILANTTSSWVLALAVSGRNLVAGTQDGGIFLSTNNGTNWTAVNNGLTNLQIRALVVSGTNLVAGTVGGIYLSTNNGTNWTQVNTGLTNSNVSALAVSGTNLFAGTYSAGVFLSTNNGTSWSAVNTGLTDTNVSALAVSGKNLFVGTYGGVWMRPISDIVDAAKGVR